MPLRVFIANPPGPADPFLDDGPWCWGLGVSRLALGARIVTWVGAWVFGLRWFRCALREMCHRLFHLFRPVGQPGAPGALGWGQPAALVSNHSKGEGYLAKARLARTSMLVPLSS